MFQVSLSVFSGVTAQIESASTQVLFVVLFLIWIASLHLEYNYITFFQ